jgi:hypothetical protein
MIYHGEYNSMKNNNDPTCRFLEDDKKKLKKDDKMQPCIKSETGKMLRKIGTHCRSTHRH